MVRKLVFQRARTAQKDAKVSSRSSARGPRKRSAKVDQRSRRDDAQLDKVAKTLKTELLEPLDAAAGDPQGVIEAISAGREHTRQLAKRSTRTYYRVIGAVYNVYWHLTQLEDDKRIGIITALSNDLPKTAKGRVVRGFDPFRILLRTMIDYPTERKIASRQVSRDARALEYAKTKKIRPSEFLDKISKPNAGLERWVQKLAELRRKERESSPDGDGSHDRVVAFKKIPTEPRKAVRSIVPITPTKTVDARMESRSGGYIVYVYVDEDDVRTAEYCEFVSEDHLDEKRAELVCSHGPASVLTVVPKH